MIRPAVFSVIHVQFRQNSCPQLLFFAVSLFLMIDQGVANMITIDELKFKLGGLETAVNDLRDALSIEASEKRLAELEHQMTLPGFYDDQEKSQKVISEMGEVKNKLERFGKLSTQYEEAQTLLEMIEEENDPSLATEGEEAVNGVEKSIDELQLMTMLNGEYDHSNAILTFHAGTGGTEAQDWAEMLTRMYTRWAEAHGYTVEVLDVLEGDEAGIKSASMMIKGANAYGMLKSENGVHRLVRISPFDANARRQTSFSSLEVMPELDNNIKVEINPADIEMQVYRSSGAGGQHINKTSSAVRLIHKPTGIVTSCQTQRSQLQNREYAMEMLKAKLYQIALQQHKDKVDDIKGVQNEIAWGHQIRSYVFMPYTLVKDHRTNYESGNVQAVMDGDLDGFIYAYLKAFSRGELQDV
jgi:peptide chain release factor 2